MLLAGRKALITGASGSLGSAIAERFAAEGCAVIVTDVHAQSLRMLEERLREKYAHANVAAAILDVTDESAVKRVFADAGSLDILVNNAGVTRMGQVEALTLQEWNEMIGLNLTSVYLCSKYALPLLRESEAPAIINMSSINAIRMNPAMPAYSAAKSGIIALTRQLALEGAGMGLRANSISPARIMSESDQTKLAAEPGFEIECDCYPLGRPGYPEEIAKAALFLASDLSSFITGVNLVVDGGASLLNASGLVRSDLRRQWKKGEYRLTLEGSDGFEPV